MSDLDLDNLLEDLDDEMEVNENVTVEVNVDETVEIADEITIDQTTTTTVTVPEVEAPTLAAKTTNSDEVQYSSEFLDIQTETKKYMQDAFNIEAEMKALKTQLTDLKNEAKEMGVPVTAVSKAIKEMIKEIKETPDEAHNVEMMKRFINEDTSLYAEVSALAV